MNTDWYSRQFGDRGRFAISISLGRDPHPIGDEVIDASWGGLSIWVRGRCLTRSVSDDGAVSEEVRWSLVSILRWLIDVGVRLINEEPFPDTTSLDHVRDACAWFNETESPLLTLTETEEDEWFLRRSDWRQHHALRRAMVDATFPNIMFRRLGDFLEVSWDNETWGTSRRGLSFVEQRGTELVAAADVASDLRSALIDVTRELAEHHPIEALKELATAASTTEVCDDDWRWLIHQQTAQVINDELVHLRDRLKNHARTRGVGLYLPHAAETLVLRQARLVSANDVRTLLDAAQAVPSEPMKSLVRDLIRPSAAPSVKPWDEGYERALYVRDALGWNNDPIPDLRTWMKQNNVGVTSPGLSPALDLVAVRTTDDQGAAAINSRAQSRIRREIGEATALGHILFDVNAVVVNGVWEHWPSAARARAFAAMLLMPDEGVKDVLRGRANIDASDVKRVMARFNTGPHATTYHLKNRRFIPNNERREDILRELVA